MSTYFTKLELIERMNSVRRHMEVIKLLERSCIPVTSYQGPREVIGIEVKEEYL